MPRVITFTANLLAETTYSFAAWEPGKTVRATEESFQVGGKGINVSKMLNKFGSANQALCFPGGAFGPMCEAWLEDAGIETLPFRNGCVTRSGAVVRAEGMEETTFLGVESLVSDEAIRDVVSYLEGIEERFVFAICGSVQGWGEDRWERLRHWIDRRGENVTLVVDNYGASLPWFAKERPGLIKINRDELETLFEEDVSDELTSRLLKRARELYVCRYWVVTDGGNDVWVMDGESEPESYSPRKVDCVSATGCGDIVFATLIDCLYNRDGYTLLQAAELGSEYASRSAAMPGIAEFEL